ncbi:methyltransferase, FxLD system [Nonomuraea recticatena]|uniref:Protein-L-isoaspartate O-methyltransferase n=1 Tax=Nonomuraea recticatena TaxID=46178 RepID=A0ABN3SP31_9ACTN
MTTDDSQAAAKLRATMVSELHDLGAIRSESVAAAVATVPRHLFAPGAPLEDAYAADNPLVIKRDVNGKALSSMSAAHIQVVMLEQADIEAGMRALEIGSGGYNAALLAEIVGEQGRVTTVDIDPEIVERAGSCLRSTGYDHVDVVLADAEEGVPANAPYDRIIVTAGAWDIPPAWLEQLRPDGRIVVPLRLKGVTRTIAFDRDGEGGLISRSYGLCGFVPFQGAGSHTERLVAIDDGVSVRLDDHTQQVDVAALRQALHSPGIERWSGAAFDLPDELELFLLTSDPHMATLLADQERIDQKLLAGSTGRGAPVLISGSSFATGRAGRTRRRADTRPVSSRTRLRTSRSPTATWSRCGAGRASTAVAAPRPSATSRNPQPSRHRPAG